MMKRFLVVLLLFPLFAGAYSPVYRIDSQLYADIGKLSTRAFVFIGLAQGALDDNNKKLEIYKKTAYEDGGSRDCPLERVDGYVRGIAVARNECNDLTKKQKILFEQLLSEVCLRCYTDEYERQVFVADSIRREAGALAEARRKLEMDSMVRVRMEADSLAKLRNASRLCGVPSLPSPYAKLSMHLDGVSRLPRGMFTVFRGLDVNFASGRLGRFLQSDVMRMALKENSKWVSGIYYTQMYVPRVSVSRVPEYIKVHYKLMLDPVFPQCYTTDKEGCQLIKEVEITGTADLVIRLFLEYWPCRIRLGGYQLGVMAHYDIMGERVTLSGTATPGICKITVRRGNGEMNYLSTFKD